MKYFLGIMLAILGFSVLGGNENQNAINVALCFNIAYIMFTYKKED